MKAPIQAFIELTKKCNQKCLHCFSSASLESKKELTTVELIHILDQLNNLGVMEIHLSGGEPLCRPDFFKILDYLSRFEYQKVTLFTNAILIDEFTIGKLVEFSNKKDNFCIQISLDGYNPKIYNLLRRDTSEAFYKVCNNIRHLVKKGVTVNTLFAASKNNCQFAIGTAKFALFDLGVHLALIIPIFLTGRAIKNRIEPEFDSPNWLNLIQKATEIKKKLLWGELSHFFNIGFFTLYELFIPLNLLNLTQDAYEVWKFPKNFSQASLYGGDFCHAGRSDIIIGSDGLVYPCVPALNNEIFSAGNAKDISLKKIWEKSEVLNWFRIDRIKCISKNCSNCDQLRLCGGGCRISAYVLTNDILGDDLRCPILKKLNDSKSK